MSRVRTRVVVALVVTSGWTCATQRVPASSNQAARRVDAPAATAVVGPEGATLSLSDGAMVVVPGGVLKVPTTISLRHVPQPAITIPSGTVRVGQVYTIEPRLSANQPITVTLPYDPKLLPAGYEEGSISIYQLRDDGRLSMVGSITDDPMPESSGQNLDVDNNRVTIRVPITATYTLLAIKDQLSHPARSAIVGDTLIARHAGSKLAINATSRSAAVTAMNVIGSCGRT
jgi:hypothetical protein